MAKLIKGENDLATLYPEIAAEWDYEENGDLTPHDVTTGSHREVHWKCRLGHTWQTIVANRVKGSGCLVCAGKKVQVGYNDLATTRPELVKEWDYKANGKLIPQKVTAGSGKIVLWRCELNHQYRARIADRTRGEGCPTCCGRRVLVGFNDMATTRPDLAEEWNYEANENLTPEMVTAHANKKVWWKCQLGHQWQAMINDRAKGVGCPVCSGTKLRQGINDLATVAPLIAAQWCYAKNGKVTPEKVARNSRRKVFWQCHLGHQWQAKINSRTVDDGCPICKEILQQHF